MILMKHGSRIANLREGHTRPMIFHFCLLQTVAELFTTQESTTYFWEEGSGEVFARQHMIHENIKMTTSLTHSESKTEKIAALLGQSKVHSLNNNGL